ncbi:guanine-1-methyltransferase-domain-containing protein [Crepidotus variabilis]|uniref:tRNA (guanine(9)-N1)-methyltransferase n=1 Tax=Crepidotus variabilis TaxID=179855 RepID=A0A9P6ETG2_9AGAR|nr:guanine-1-methyltransferase-domain-containing protein [Crepidotus variabilis]
MGDNHFDEADPPQKEAAKSVVTVTEEANAITDFRAETRTERNEPSRDADLGLVASTDNMEMVADATGRGVQPVISKNAMKRARRAEHFATVKLERRAREKAAKKEKKRERAEMRAAGDLDEEDHEQRTAKKPKLDFGGTVVVDLGFDDLMSEKEVTSLCSQLAYTYSCNRRASFPFSLIYTSLNGKTHQRLETLGEASYKRWSHTKWFEGDYETLWQPQPNALHFSEPKTSVVEPAFSTSTERLSSNSPPQATTSPAAVKVPNLPDLRRTSPKTGFIYLTADTEDELTELSPNETYIIGGICDHNRYKNLCINKARESGIRTARLPIGRYLASLPTRKVLTVNQVFEILVKWVETKDWEEALYSVIPKRKFQQGAKVERSKVIDAADVEDTFGEEVAPSEQLTT